MSKGLVFTLLMTYGGAAVALFNPFVGLLIYVCFAIVRPDSMWHWSVPQGNYSRFVALALLVGWTTQMFGRWRAEAPEQRLIPGVFTFAITQVLNGVALVVGWPVRAFGRGQLAVTLLLQYWLWVVMSSFLAENAATAWGYVEAVAKLLLIFLVGLSCIDSVAKLKQLAWVIVLSQGFVAYELNLNYFGGGNQAFIEDGFGGMDNNCNAIAMVTCIGLAFFLGLHARRWWHTGVATAMALLMVHVVMFSFSRGGLLSLVIVGVVSFLLIPKRLVHYIAFAVAVLIGFQLAGPEVRQRFFTTFANSSNRDASAESRLELWNDCLDVMEKNPFFGAGPDHWPLIAHTYGWPRGKEAHTLWLQIGAEVGLPALAILLVFFLSTIGRVWFMSRRPDLPDPWLANVARMVIPSLAGFMVSAQFVSLKGLEVPYYVALLAAGAMKVAAMQKQVAAPLPTTARCHEVSLIAA
jgi:probable O-glycosylation ligase (exosortase A-associated)